MHASPITGFFRMLLLVCLPIGAILGPAALRGQNPVMHVGSAAQFEALAGEPITDKYGQVSSLKLLMVLKDSSIHFIPSADFQYHFDYCRAKLGYWKEHAVFNVHNYSQDRNRDFCLANLNHYHSNDLWTLELSSADDFPAQLIAPFVRTVQRAFFMPDSLQLLLNTLSLDQKVHGLPKLPCRIVDVNTIYAGQSMQALNKSVAYGYIREYAPEEVALRPPGIHDIVVLTGDLLEIPPVAGLLTTNFQTPLSHLVLLCKNRGTPFVADRKLRSDPRVRSMEGRLVRFEVFQDSFTVRPAHLEEANAHWEKMRPVPISLRCVVEDTGLLQMKDLSWKDVDRVGGKAANFAELQKLAKASKGQWKVPEGGFAIPFHHYRSHMQASGANNLVECLLNNPANTDAEMLRECLTEIQDRIRGHAVDSNLLKMIDVEVSANSPSKRMRFRSSTNAEDIEGFNGAGLYESRTGTVGEGRSVEKAIQKVWASLWCFEAFQERAFFGINQRQIAMGLLVHRSFPEEMANGVAITSNLYRPGYYGFVINAQAGETSVVSPPPGVTCEQLICYQDSELEFFRQKRIIEYIARSSLNEGAPVLSEQQVLDLTSALAKVKYHYYWKSRKKQSELPYSDFALDVEFKFDSPDGQLYLKQVRPFKQ